MFYYAALGLVLILGLGGCAKAKPYPCTVVAITQPSGGTFNSRCRQVILETDNGYRTWECSNTLIEGDKLTCWLHLD